MILSQASVETKSGETETGLEKTKHYHDLIKVMVLLETACYGVRNRKTTLTITQQSTPQNGWNKVSFCITLI